MNPNQNLMLSFEGETVPGWLSRDLTESPPAGVTLFREENTTSPDQVAELVESLQAANTGDGRLLVAMDQEGGQLQGLVGSTPFAGNMALGATGDVDLTLRVAAAMGRELAAVGINLNYAPVADVATLPRNPSLGVRSFGGDPETVSRHVRAAVTGFRSTGVLCTLKHFPGKGEAVVDPHYELPRLDLDRERLDRVELRPFAAGFDAGADLLMTGHYSVPAITGSETTPVSMSPRAIQGLVRDEMGFGGLVITDALDMGALDQGAGQVLDMVASLYGGTDLLLVMPDQELRTRARLAVERGLARGLIPKETLERSRGRIAAVRRHLSQADLDPGVVGSHGELAAELATKSITLVRNDQGVIPLSLESTSKVLVLEPEPTNVTPADTTALYDPSLAPAVRQRHGNVAGIVYPHDPEPSHIAALVDRARGHDLVIVATVNATPGQADLVRRLSGPDATVITVSLREPQDLGSYPEATTHVCAYSGHGPSVDAVVGAIFGESAFSGRLPVTIPGLYESGHGL